MRRMSAVHRRDAVVARFGAGDAAVAGVIVERQRVVPSSAASGVGVGVSPAARPGAAVKALRRQFRSLRERKKRPESVRAQMKSDQGWLLPLPI